MKKINTITNIYMNAYAAKSIKTVRFESKHLVEERDILLYEQYQTLRTEFSRHYQWPLPESGLDIDNYDTDTPSTYLIAHQREKVVAGIRFTNVESINESLSYSMWQDAIGDVTQEDVKARYDAFIGKHKAVIWDATRLMSYTGLKSNKTQKERALSRVGVLKILLDGMFYFGGPNSVWIFTVDQRMMKFLERQNIPLHILAKSKISYQDVSDSYFCVIKPHEVKQTIQERMPLFKKIIFNLRYVGQRA